MTKEFFDELSSIQLATVSGHEAKHVEEWNILGSTTEESANEYKSKLDRILGNVVR